MVADGKETQSYITHTAARTFMAQSHISPVKSELNDRKKQLMREGEESEFTAKSRVKH